MINTCGKYIDKTIDDMTGGGGRDAVKDNGWCGVVSYEQLVCTVVEKGVDACMKK